MAVGICMHLAPWLLVRSDTDRLDKKAWHTVNIPVNPKVIQWGWGQVSVKAAETILHQPWEIMSL